MLPKLFMLPALASMWDGVTSTDFQGILDEVKGGFPIILPVVISYLAFRKGWSFVKGQLKGA